MRSIKLIWTVITLVLLQQLASCSKSNPNSGGTTPTTPTTTPEVVLVATVTTLAGSGTATYADGIGTAASFSGPNGVAVDAQGNVFVVDQTNNRIRKITAAGLVTTIAGDGVAGNTDGAGANARFNAPTRIAIDASGNMYVADEGNNRIRKITPAGVVTTLAGSSSGYAEGTGTGSKFYAPDGIAVDAQGNVFVADQGNSRIRKITPAGVVSTFAGSGTAGYADATGGSAKFSFPTDVAIDAQGNLFIGDNGNFRVRKINSVGDVSTVAGNGLEGFIDGTAASAEFRKAIRVAVDAKGNLYVGDQSNQRIRKIDANGMVTTLAGNGVAGFADGLAINAQFNNPAGVAVDAQGNVYVGDWNNNRVRKISYTVK